MNYRLFALNPNHTQPISSLSLHVRLPLNPLAKTNVTSSQKIFFSRMDIYRDFLYFTVCEKVL